MVLHQRSLLALADRVLAMAEGRITTYGKIEMPAAAQANAAQPDAQRETSSECASDSGANTMPPAMTH
jgi:ABC-type protease/lipase transport system fused ATPase/permease subunit